MSKYVYRKSKIKFLWWSGDSGFCSKNCLEIDDFSFCADQNFIKMKQKNAIFQFFPPMNLRISKRKLFLFGKKKLSKSDDTLQPPIDFFRFFVGKTTNFKKKQQKQQISKTDLEKSLNLQIMSFLRLFLFLVP